METSTLLDFVECAEDHLDQIRKMIGPSLDGDTMDHIVACATYAKRRLDQLVEELLATTSE